MSHRKTKQEWMKLFDEHAKTEQSIKAFCRSRRMCPSYFCKQRKHFGWQRPEASKLTQKPQKQQAPCFVKVASQQPIHEQAQLKIGNSILYISKQCDPLWLSQVLKGLSA